MSSEKKRLTNDEHWTIANTSTLFVVQVFEVNGTNYSTNVANAYVRVLYSVNTQTLIQNKWKKNKTQNNNDIPSDV